MSDGELTTEMLAELLGAPRSDRIVDLVAAITQGDLAETLQQVDGALGEGLALEQLSDALQGYFRDLLILRNCGPQSDLVDVNDAAVRAKMVEQSQNVDDATLVYNITVMEDLRRSIVSSGSGRALLEAAMVRLSASDRFSDTKALLEQLQELQNIPVSGPSPAAQAGAVSRPTRPTTIQDRGPGVRADQNQAGAGVEPGRAQEKELTPPKVLDLQYLQRHWPEITVALGKRGGKGLEAYLQLAQPVAFGDGVLRLGYRKAQDGMRKLLTERPEQVNEITAALTAMLGQAIKLELTQIEDGAAAARPGPKRDNISPGARPSQEQINAAMADPQVRQVQQVLGGQVRQIDRVTDHERE